MLGCVLLLHVLVFIVMVEGGSGSQKNLRK